MTVKLLSVGQYIEPKVPNTVHNDPKHNGHTHSLVCSLQLWTAIHLARAILALLSFMYNLPH